MSYFKEKTTNEESCVCKKKNAITLSIRHTSWLICSFIILGFFIFIAGYFLGKRKVGQEFSDTITQESLADQVYSSVCTLYETEEKPAEQLIYPDSYADNKNSFTVAKAENEKDLIEPDETIYVEKEHKENKKYYAQLVGFGTKRAADQFIKRLEKKNIPVQLKQRHSKTSKGKHITWYQVATNTYNEKEKLTTLVEQIKKVERLHDVRILEI